MKLQIAYSNLIMRVSTYPIDNKLTPGTEILPERFNSITGISQVPIVLPELNSTTAIIPTSEETGFVPLPTSE